MPVFDWRQWVRDSFWTVSPATVKCSFIFVCVCVCSCTCMWRPAVDSGCFQSLSIYLLRQGISLGPRACWDCSWASTFTLHSSGPRNLRQECSHMYSSSDSSPQAPFIYFDGSIPRAFNLLILWQVVVSYKVYAQKLCNWGTKKPTKYFITF